MFKTVIDLFTGGFTKYLIIAGLVLAGFLFLSNYQSVMGFFGYETREVLKEKVKTAEQNVQTAADANASLKDAVKIGDQTVKNTNDVISDKVTKDTKTLGKVTQINRDTREEVKTISLLPIDDIEKTEKISEARFTSVWKAFCSFNQDPECQEVLAADSV